MRTISSSAPNRGVQPAARARSDAATSTAASAVSVRGPIDLSRLQVLAVDFAPGQEFQDAPVTITTHDQARLLALVRALRDGSNDTRLAWEHEGRTVRRKKGVLMVA